MNNQPTPFRRLTPPAAALAACAIAASVLADDDRSVTPADPGFNFTQIPGVQEFTGRIIARPWPIADLIARGLSPDDAAAQDHRARARLAPGLIQLIDQTDEFLVATPVDRTDGEFARELVDSGDYQYAHPDWLCYPASTPNDDRFKSQYHHTLMQSDFAWTLWTGSPAIVCAVVDTGVTLDHPDLVGRLVSGYNAPDQLPEAAGGDVSDPVGHGTNVAGCVAATGNNAVGICGMGWSLALMPVRASNLSNGAAPLSTILAGARWAADNGAKVVSVSYTGVQSASVQTTGAYIRSDGGLFCYAADNTNRNWSTFDWADVLVVGATEPNDVKADFSSYGTAIDCVAPGRDILTTAAAFTSADGYTIQAGTSFSTPIVAGALALIWSANPSLTSYQVQEALLLGCEDIGDPGDDALYGHGRVNVYRSLSIALHGPDAPIPTPDEFLAVQGVPVRLDVLANDVDPMGRPMAITAFPAATARGGSLARSAGSGPDGRDELLYTPPAGPSGAGDDAFTYAVSTTTGFASTTATIHVADPAVLLPASAATGFGPGLRVAYYDLVAPLVLPDFTQLASFATDAWASIDFPLTGDDFAGSLRIDDVGAVAQGYLSVPADGVYTLFLDADDGARILVDNQEVARIDGLHALAEAAGQIGLRAGPHRLRVEYFERRLDCGLIASIAGPGLPVQVIPASMLSHDAPNALDVNFDGSVDPDDLSDFISMYFDGDRLADFNSDGVVNPDDLADYISDYFSH